MGFSLLWVWSALAAEVARREDIALSVESTGALGRAHNPWCFLQDEAVFQHTGQHLVQVAMQVPTCTQCTTRELTFMQNVKVPLPYHVHGYLEGKAGVGSSGRGHYCECTLSGAMFLKYVKHRDATCGKFECWEKWIEYTEKDTPELGLNSQLKKQDVQLNLKTRAAGGLWSQACGVDLAVPDWFDGVTHRRPMVALKSHESSSVVTQLAVPVYGNLRYEVPEFLLLPRVPDEAASLTPAVRRSGVTPDGALLGLGLPITADCMIDGGDGVFTVVDPSFCENAELMLPVLCCHTTTGPVVTTALDPVRELNADSAGNEVELTAPRTWTVTMTTVQRQETTVNCEIITDYDTEKVNTHLTQVVEGRPGVCD